MSIADNGIGMTPEILQSIFEPFFTTKERGKGTGLGLSTVYGIVRQGKGFIDVSSNVGEGTVFNLYFPCIQDTIVVHESTSAGTTAGTVKGGETVLVVEDELSIRRLIQNMLETSGYNVLTAADGDEAVDVTKRYSSEITLLLTDVIMPGMNGKEVFDALRVLQPKLKVLFTSGYTDEIIEPRGVLGHTVAYIAKPFSREMLVAKIREVLSDEPHLESSLAKT
jgi:CheY-like chemotaxis protein